MKRMRLLGMHRAFKNCLETKSSGNVTPDEMVAMAVESEWNERYNRSIENRTAQKKYVAFIYPRYSRVIYILFAAFLLNKKFTTAWFLQLALTKN